MWTVLFGDDEAPTHQPPQVKAQPAPSPQLSTPPVTPSPLEDARPSTPPPQKQQPQRPSITAEPTTISTKETDDTPMAMLLKRLNNLMIKVGEHEFEKKTLVDQMEKERKLLAAKIGKLEQQIENLQDQNVQLQYKVEYTSEPMLMERVQDITDMRDALDGVKKQLEAELQLKENELGELKTGLTAKDKKLEELRQEYEQQIADLSAQCEVAKQEAVDAAKIADDAANVKYEAQLQQNEDALQTVTALKETLEASLVEKEQAIDEAEATLAQVQRTLVEVQANGEADVKNLQQQLEEAIRLHEQLQQQLGESTRGNEQLFQQQLEEAAHGHEQELQSVRDENQAKLEALEAHADEKEALAAEKSQELEDYKHDCVELWKINEDLKQQIALTSAETMLKQAELRENALSGQSVLQDKVTDLENQLEALQEQLNGKMQEIAELKAEAESHAIVGSEDEASGEDEDKFVVVENGGGAIRVLTDQVATAQRELMEAMELNLHLNNRNAWLEEQYQMLSSVQSDGDDDQDESGATKVSLEEHIAALELELQEARRAANEKVQHVTDLEHNYGALSTEYDRLRVAHNGVIEAKQADDAMLNDLRRELETIRASEASASSDKDRDLFAKEQELVELRTSCTALSDQVNRLLDVERQLQQTKDALMMAQNNLAETETTNVNLKRELDDLKSLSAAASTNNEHAAALQNELAYVRSEKDAMSTELTQYQTSIHDLQVKLHELEGVVETQVAEKKVLEQQLQNLQEMAQENIEGSYELQTNLESTMEELEKAKIQLRAEQERCESLQQAVETVKLSSIPREELERAQSEIASLEGQIRQLRGLEQSLNQQLQGATQSKDLVIAQLQAAQSERIAAENEQKRLHSLYEQMASKVAATDSSSSDLQRSNDDLSHSLEQTRSKASQLEQQVSAMRAEHGDAQKQVEALTKKNLSLVSEIQSIREEADNQKQIARVQLEQLTMVQSNLQHELAEVKQAFQNKDAEVAAAKQRSQTDVAQLEDLVNRYKADKQSSDQRLAQFNAECEHLRQSHSESKVAVERSQQELGQVRAQMDKIQQVNATLEAEVSRLRGANDEKTRLLQEVEEKQRVNQRLEETNRELEGLLNKSKAYCEELSRESEDKVSRMQEFASHVEQEARDEIDRIVHENGLLRDELEQLAQVRYEETSAHDELRVKLAELQAENNVLSARAHRLTQQLSQYTDLPEDDEMAAAGQGQTPDLWELLSSGMEQLKADLELASKYAASIDASSVDGRTEAGGDESFTVAN
ncbi:hypothetical protein BBO99_00003268 [Phytophthora kernoviae]|uniref:Uncharacterized protein n=1 Tax=Phytophthora kernoviae TaxID=325452 RepID=A0A3R7G135_9STRA|nr:hypothetical protein JM16_004146 [Phytophthora kernoviae]KAG2527648.1 hypothetical protein JM18_003620 [Phytophthora kernoviae]RLN14192.1 hypothetical protein BBI17_004444 [Phytophthora kernoviae]RLN81949.1 hypothetical protein BBO99_00003268 [Phytophthora kernoviae]